MLQDLFAPVAAQSLTPVLHEQAHYQVFSNITDREAMPLLIGPARLFMPNQVEHVMVVFIIEGRNGGEHLVK